MSMTQDVVVCKIRFSSKWVELWFEGNDDPDTWSMSAKGGELDKHLTNELYEVIHNHGYVGLKLKVSLNGGSYSIVEAMGHRAAPELVSPSSLSEIRRRASWIDSGEFPVWAKRALQEGLINQIEWRDTSCHDFAETTEQQLEACGIALSADEDTRRERIHRFHMYLNDNAPHQALAMAEIRLPSVLRTRF